MVLVKQKNCLQFKQLQRSPEKIQVFNGIWTITSALTVTDSNQLSYEATHTPVWGVRSVVSSCVPVKVIEWQMKYKNEP